MYFRVHMVPRLYILAVNTIIQTLNLCQYAKLPGQANLKLQIHLEPIQNKYVTLGKTFFSRQLLQL